MIAFTFNQVFPKFAYRQSDKVSARFLQTSKKKRT